MFLSKASVGRPIAMTCLIIVLVIFGANSYRKLGMDNMPNIDVPFVTVTTEMPGASPAEIEVNVARKIEDAVSAVDGLKHLNSTCMDNVCQTLLEFNLDVNVDDAAVDVREKINLIMDELPEEAESPEIVKFDPNSKAVVTLMFEGSAPLDEIYDYADDKLSPRLTTISGVAKVEISGGDELELHVEIDPERLAGFGLTTSQVAEALKGANVKIPAGRLKEGRRELTITYDAEVRSPEEAGALEIGSWKGSRVYLRDVADIRMESKEKRTKAFLDGKPAVCVKVVKKGEANALRVVERVREAVDKINAEGSLPGGMKLRWFTDDGEFIKSNVDDAWSSVLLGMALTALILLIFLQDMRSTFIVSISMPVSIVVTFAAMKLLGYTFNNMTLLAIGTSVGTLVTNSIVVLENIFRHISKGATAKHSSDVGTAEVELPVFASAMTNVVVFVPIALMPSIVGRYFTPFAITMTVATLVSLFISYTLTPTLALWLARPLGSRPKRRVPALSAAGDAFNRAYGWLERRYGRSMETVAKKPWIPVAVSIGAFILTMGLVAPHVGSAFFPENDRGEFIIKLEFPTYFNLDATTARTLAIEERLRKEMPGVLSSSAVVGKTQGVIGQVSEGVHLAEITLKTVQKGERKESMDRMRSIIRQGLEGETDCLFTVNVPSVIGGSSAMFEMEVSGSDLPTIEALAKRMLGEMASSGLASDADSSVRSGRQELKIRPARAILRDMGISAAALGAAARGNIEGLKAGTFKLGDRTFDIRVELEERPGVSQVLEYSFGSMEGRPLLFDALSAQEDSYVPIQINRSEKSRVAKLYANPAPGVPLGNLNKGGEGERREGSAAGLHDEVHGTGREDARGARGLHGGLDPGRRPDLLADSGDDGVVGAPVHNPPDAAARDDRDVSGPFPVGAAAFDDGAARRGDADRNSRQQRNPDHGRGGAS